MSKIEKIPLLKCDTTELTITVEGINVNDYLIEVPSSLEIVRKINEIIDYINSKE